MFTPFFYLLRSRGLKISPTEWLDFVRAVDSGLANADFTRFYHLARSVLVKSEADFDRFDGAFLEFFRGIALRDGADDLPPELLRWLEKPDADGLDAAAERAFLSWSEEKLEQMLRERLAEQKEEHNGGTYWIGTGGASPFGHGGNGPGGIRVGGRSRRRSALRVAGERRFRDFRGDAGLDERSFQIAFRRLRQFSSRVDAPRSELDMDGTVRRTCDNAGRLELAFERPRKNAVRLMLLMDSGGSMDPYADLCASLFRAVDRSSHFRDLKVYYFHNCFKRLFYLTPAIDSRESVAMDWLMDNIDPDYKVIVIGDALMDPRELAGRYAPGRELSPTGLTRLRAFRDRYRHLAWFTPGNNELIDTTWWGQSYDIIKKEVPVLPLTVENLAETFGRMVAAR